MATGYKGEGMAVADPGFWKEEGTSVQLSLLFEVKGRLRENIASVQPRPFQ